MAIQYVGGQTTEITTGDQAITFALTGGLASVPAAGDFVLVTVAIATNVTDLSVGVTTSGYSEITELFSNDTYASNLSVSRKFMGATPDTTVTVTGRISAPNGGVAVIQVYRGVDPVTPLDVTTTIYPGTNTAIVNPAAITPITSGAYIVISGMGAHSRDTTGTYTASYLTSFIQKSINNTYDCTAAMGYVPWTSGSYNPAPWTFNAGDTTSFSYAVATMALRPDGTEITGTASGAVNSTGLATGTLPIASSASGAETASGTASGATAVAAGASGGLTTSGSSTGAAVVSASASGQTSVTGSATGGMIAISGEASTTYLISGSSAGGAPTPISAEAGGNLSVFGLSTAQTPISGAALDTYIISGRSGENVSSIRYGEDVVIAAYFGDTPVNVIAVGDHVVLEW